MTVTRHGRAIWPSCLTFSMQDFYLYIIFLQSFYFKIWVLYHVIKCHCHCPLSDLQAKTWRGMTAAQTGPSLCHQRCTKFWGNPVCHSSIFSPLDSHTFHQSDYQHQTQAHTKPMSTFFSQVEDPKRWNACYINILVYVWLFFYCVLLSRTQKGLVHLDNFNQQFSLRICIYICEMLPEEVLSSSELWVSWFTKIGKDMIACEPIWDPTASVLTQFTNICFGDTWKNWKLKVICCGAHCFYFPPQISSIA